MYLNINQSNKFFKCLKFCVLQNFNVNNFCTKNTQKQLPVIFFNKTNNYKGVVVGELQSEHNKNAFSYAMIKELNKSFDKIKADQNARILIIRSAIPGVFCAGADLKERYAMPNNEVNVFVTGLQTLLTKLAKLSIPTIAEIDGIAFGGGLELALACDIRITSKNSTMGLIETQLGIIPGAGGTQRLSRIIGIAKAKELIFTGAKISGEEAKKIGLVNYTVDNPSEKSLELCQKILKAGPLAIKAAKMAIDCGYEVDINSGLLFEQQGYLQVIYTKDRTEGMKAFIEKRNPIYTGKFSYKI